MKADIKSPYIKPFLGKDNASLIKAMDEHQCHNYPLTEEQMKLEGSTNAYGKKDEMFYGRR